MPRKWQAIAWSRELPKPIRNGRFYELGHKIAIILAGHAHTDGTGITVGAETLAREAWCTPLEAMEALRWLEDEKWLIRSQGPKGVEWECNPDVSRGDVDEVEEKATYTRLRKAKNMRDMRERKRLDKLNCTTEVTVTVPGNAPVTQSGHAAPPVTGVSDQRDRGPLPVLPGTVTDSGHACGHTCRSETCKTLKTHEDPREDPTTCTVPVRSEPEQGAMFPTKTPPPGPRSLDYPAEFETFWAAWRAHNPKDSSGAPKRPASGKGAAAKALPGALRRADLDTIIGAIPAYMASEKPQRGFCHDASTWLNTRGWDDEYTPYRTSKPNGFVPQSFDQTDYHDTGGFGA